MSNLIEIRLAKESDLEALFSLQKQLGAVHHDSSFYEERKPLFLEHYITLLKHPLIFVFVAVESNNLLGFLVGNNLPLWWDYNQSAYTIDALAVDQNSRGTGVGSALVEFFEKLVQDRGGQEIILNSNFKRIEAHHFYEKNGYLKEGYRFSKKLI